jgi:hypothetical protein
MSEERIIGPNGEVWTAPGLNEPARAKPDWLLRLQMDEANAKPIPRACFAIERWMRRGGSAGLSCNGNLWSGTKPK